MSFSSHHVQTSYSKWLKQPAYVGDGVHQGTKEEAMLHFFYEGVSPWIRSFGYNWSDDEAVIARKFVRLCYDINTTSAMSSNYTLQSPKPSHRNYTEDSDTFDYFASSWAFTEFLETWKFRDEVVGTRLEHILLEFCYVWVDVTSGRPGKVSQKALDAEAEEMEAEEQAEVLETYSRRNWSLY